MIVFAGIATGLVCGVRLAGRHGGTRADKIQYAAVCAIAGALLGVILTVAVERLVG